MLSVNCDHRSNPMFRPTTCLVSRVCTSVSIIDLLFAPRQIHKADTIYPWVESFTYELGQSLEADFTSGVPWLFNDRSLMTWWWHKGLPYLQTDSSLHPFFPCPLERFFSQPDLGQVWKYETQLYDTYCSIVTACWVWRLPTWRWISSSSPSL